MFDAKRGENIARSIYHDAFELEHVDLWYQMYNPIDCWDRFVVDDVSTFNEEAVTDLIAWLVSVGTEAEKIFCDGATWALACKLDEVHDAKTWDEAPIGE